MSLVSMKRGTEDDCKEVISENPYGYGLELRLDDEQCKALGINSAIPAGSKLHLNAMAFVRNSSQRLEDEEDEPEIEYSLCLQITDLELSAPGNLDKAADKLYPAASSTGKA